MLRRTTYHFLSLLILSLWVISCQTTPDSVVQTLSLVEKCMEVAPDSALNLLKRIPNPDVLHGKAQADYSSVSYTHLTIFHSIASIIFCFV